MDTSLNSCSRCGGTGFRLSVALDKIHRHSIPFEVLLAQAEPCDCMAGPWFAARQMEFLTGPAHSVRQDEPEGLRRIPGGLTRVPLRQIA